ncbi:MAG: hypothetical protein AB8B87_14520 [Granulosicoccus sp.]
MSTSCTAQNLSFTRDQSRSITPSRAISQPADLVSKKLDNDSRLTIIKRFVRKLIHRYSVRREQKIARDAFIGMLSLEDELLDDIGVTRADVRWAANLPLSEDAAAALREVSGR